MSVKNKLKNLSQHPGVYQMLDKDGGQPVWLSVAGRGGGPGDCDLYPVQRLAHCL